MEIINKEDCLKNVSIFDNDLELDLDPKEYGFDDLEEIKDVIINAFNGKLDDGLDSIVYVKEYIHDLIGDGNDDELFEYIARKYDFEDHPETLRDAEEEYENALKTLNALYKCLDVDEIKRMNQFINPSQHISVKNIIKEKRLPEDMEGEILGFIGKTKITGGKKKKTKKLKMSKKSKKSNQRNRKIIKTRNIKRKK